MRAGGNHQPILGPRTAAFQAFVLHAVAQKIAGAELFGGVQRQALAVVVVAGVDVAHIALATADVVAMGQVFHFGFLRVQPGVQRVQQREAAWRPLVLDAEAGASGIRFLRDAGWIQRTGLVVVFAVVFGLVAVDGEVQLVFPGDGPVQFGQHGVRIPVVRIHRHGAQAFRVFTAAMHGNNQRLQVRIDLGGGGDRVHAAGTVRGVAEFVVGVQLAGAVQIVFRRLGDERYRAAQAWRTRAARAGAGTDSHFAESLRIEIVAADAEGVIGRTVRLAGGVRQRDAIQFKADAIAFDTTDVEAGIGGAVPHAATATGCRRHADQRRITGDTGHVDRAVLFQLAHADHRGAAITGGVGVVALGLHQDFRQLAGGFGFLRKGRRRDNAQHDQQRGADVKRQRRGLLPGARMGSDHNYPRERVIRLALGIERSLAKNAS
jgi:hypothetical protein